MNGFIKYLKDQYHYAERTLVEKEKQIILWKNLCSRKQNFDKLGTQELLKMVELQQKKYTLITVNNQIRTIEQYFEYLQITGKRKDHPLKDFRIKTPKRPLITGFLAEEELQNIEQEFREKKYKKGQFSLFGKRNQIILGLMIYQGLSSGCLRALQVQNIDLEKGMIKVPKATENRLKERILPLKASQILELYKYITETRTELLQISKTIKETEKLFIIGENTKFSSITKEIRKQINIESLQLIRNSRINLWLKQYNLREVQYKAGFRYLRSLEYFNQTELENLKQEIEKYIS
ncbi:tyrosine-type recombinase/integrase [Chryseobacterium sp. AG844]|uniref:tyrosine-type recombinase/integrase n=1 Tax=Chryseobacterium sp. AG844 TaxID=2183998 RepID=UPI000D7159F3|nr:site-specific integrase [Chryseobacterium sp. AG844]PWW19223.1 phage integrase family protein [Chryseobacterium sp. AG844]PWW19229.1 phage integrase family protein [Chryseobacterium sp. AG844]